MTIGDARSFLLVAGHMSDQFEVGMSSDAQVVIFDLEDSVPEIARDRAREEIRAWLDRATTLMEVPTVAVRINPVGSPFHADDLELVRDVGAVPVLARCEQVADTDSVAEMVGRPLIALIETPRGMENARDLARAGSVVRLAFGSIDYMARADIDPSDTDAVGKSRARLVAASLEADIPAPIDGVTIALTDMEQLRRDVMAAAGLGMRGKLCLTARQVAVVNSLLK